MGRKELKIVGMGGRGEKGRREGVGRKEKEMGMEFNGNGKEGAEGRGGRKMGGKARLGYLSKSPQIPSYAAAPKMAPFR